jgi:hypothetical protein
VAKLICWRRHMLPVLIHDTLSYMTHCHMSRWQKYDKKANFRCISALEKLRYDYRIIKWMSQKRLKWLLEWMSRWHMTSCQFDTMSYDKMTKYSYLEKSRILSHFEWVTKFESYSINFHMNCFVYYIIII